MFALRQPAKALCLAFLIIFADFFTKFYSQKYLPLMHGGAYPYGGMGIFKNFLGIEFSLVHIANKGAAWGLFADFQVYLLLLRAVLIIGLLAYILFYNKHPAWELPLVLITSGAIGNIIDYFLYGHVVDMFHFVLWGYDYPVFNLADSAICIGIFWLFLVSWAEEPSTKSL